MFIIIFTLTSNFSCPDHVGDALKTSMQSLRIALGLDSSNLENGPTIWGSRMAQEEENWGEVRDDLYEMTLEAGVPSNVVCHICGLREHSIR